MLLFHQMQFRNSVSSYYAHPAGSHNAGSALGGNNAGFVSVFLANCALSLRLVDDSQRRQLVELGVEPDSLRELILTKLRLRLLDVISLGSLEAVQMCVLLGSYYLYYGEPELAWPLCGCALRLAQALGLHRSPPSLAPGLHSGSSIDPSESEERKRCWWAIHEIDTFCSMIYGFPQSISDEDCDVEPLYPHDPWSMAADAQRSPTGRPTLLEYKCAMLRLSKIIKSTLSEVYGTQKKSSRDSRRSPSTLHDLITRVASLDAQLAEWHSGIPDMLKIGDMEELAIEQRTSNPPASNSIEQLFQLQALALKLAYENTRILIHRPLLSHKASKPVDRPTRRQTQDYCSLSIKTCRDAALQVSWAGHAAIFHTASTTYALSFVSLHLLTAGVTLCIMTSLDPLSRQAQEWKLGIRRIMQMLMSLKLRTVLADQGLRLLKKLLRLVMEKETEKMVNVGPEIERSAIDVAETPVDNQSFSTYDLSNNFGLHIMKLT